MTREQASKAAAKRWGKRAMWRVEEKSSSPERRESARAEAAELKAKADALSAEIKRRLDALDWLTEMNAERLRLRKAADRAGWGAMHYKFTVGENVGYAFVVKGQGDTWEEAFAKADAHG